MIICLLFLFVVPGFYVFFQLALRREAADELALYARQREAAEKLTRHPDVRQRAKDVFARAEALYKPLRHRLYQVPLLRGNVRLLQEASSAHAALTDSMTLAERDCSLAQHVRNTLCAIRLQVNAFDKTFARHGGCQFNCPQLTDLLTRTDSSLATQDYESAEATVNEAFKLVIAHLTLQK